MTFKLRNIDVIRRGAQAIEDKQFNDIILIADESDSDSIDQFVNLRSLNYDPATLTEISDVLDGDGQCVFDVNYSIDSESALRANVKKVKFEVYVKDPAAVIFPTVGLRTGTKTYINRRLLDVMGAQGKGVLGSGVGPAASVEKTGGQPATCKTDRSNTREINRGLVAEFEVNTGVNVGNRQLFLGSVRDASVRPRFELPPPQDIAIRQDTSLSLATDALSQDYVAIAAPNIKINTTTVGPCEQTVRGLSGAKANAVDSRLAESLTTRFQESTQRLGARALLSGVDPTAHLNMFYGSGPTSSGGSPREPIRYDGSTTLKNALVSSKAGRSADNSFVSTRPSGTQAITTQKLPNFRGSDAQEALYRKSASISLPTAKSSLISNIPIRQITFRSSLRQFRSEFDVSLLSLRPKVNRYLWVVVKLLGPDNRTYRSKTFRIDVRRQLKGYLTPTIPPSLGIVAQSEGKIELDIEQRDPTATDVSIFRMVARPEDLGEATWERVADIRANLRRGSTKFVDDRVTANVAPNVVLYEARCSGPFGSICSTTTRVIELGVKRITNLTRSKRQGTCNIVAVQNGNRIEISVSRVPEGVTRVFLRKELVNTALRERDFRKSLSVPTKDLRQEYYSTLESNGTFVFEDTGVINRQVYRYFAQFDWLDRERTNSVTEEFIEYRTVPDRPVISYLDKVNTGIDDLGRSFVTFELGATFADAGLEELNRILGDTGVSSLFVDELKKDRSLISSLLLFQVTRKNTKTEESVVWPLVQEGVFVDNEETRAAARGASGPGVDASLRAGAQYLYTARLNIVNPERFFKEALTRIPASTRQIITDTDPSFVRVSAAKFAENFAVQPGTIQSPTTLEKETKFSEEVQGAYTGISFTQIVDVPIFNARPKSVKATRSGLGRPANVIKWSVEGSIETVYSFQVDVTLGRENTFPLRSVSPTVSEDGQYEVRDELFVREIAPVSYSVSVIYTDMSRSDVTRSNEIYPGTSIPIRLLDIAIRKQITVTPSADLSKIRPGTLEARQIEAAVNPSVVGPIANPAVSGQNLLGQVQANRSVLLSPEGRDLLQTNNPLRKLRES